MKNCTKYRLPSNTNTNSILKQLACDLDLFIYKLSVSYNKPIAFLNQSTYETAIKIKFSSMIFLAENYKRMRIL